MGGRGLQQRLPRTVVIGTNWLGDTIMSLPALAALREHLRGDEIHVEAPRPLGVLIRLAIPVDGILERDGRLSTARRIRRLRQGGYDRAVLFPNSFRAAWIAWRAHIPRRCGYAGQWRGWLLSDPVRRARPPQGTHHSESYLDIVRSLGWSGSRPPRVRLTIRQESLRWAREVVGDEVRAGHLVGLCPGAAYGPAKRWGASRFVEVASALRDRHGARILLMGSAQEAGFIRGMAATLGRGVLDMSGRTDSEQLAALLALCDLVISNDSGAMHLAALLGTPVVALFGSTDPSATAPMGPHRIVKASVECSPCLKRKCPDGSYRCLEAITPAHVLAAAEAMLEEAVSRQGSPP